MLQISRVDRLCSMVVIVMLEASLSIQRAEPAHNLQNESTPKVGGFPPTGCPTIRENWFLTLYLSRKRDTLPEQGGDSNHCPSLPMVEVHRLSTSRRLDSKLVAR